MPIGALVELDNGARLFVIRHTRDCDQTALYTLSLEDPFNPGEVGETCESHGHPEECLTLIRGPEVAG